MVFAMLAMQELCVRVNAKRDSTVSSISPTRSFLGTFRHSGHSLSSSVHASTLTIYFRFRSTIFLALE